MLNSLKRKLKGSTPGAGGLTGPLAGSAAAGGGAAAGGSGLGSLPGGPPAPTPPLSPGGGIEDTPRADLALPHAARRERRYVALAAWSHTSCLTHYLGHSIIALVACSDRVVHGAVLDCT